MNKKILTAVISWLLISHANAQKIHIATANLERKNFKNGIMVLYYGPSRIVKYCALWDVVFNKDESEESIAGKLESRVAASDPYMHYEFLNGYDCMSARNYLIKKGVSKMNIGGCTYTNLSSQAGSFQSVYDPEASKRIVGDGETVDFSKEDYVDRLMPAEVKNLKSFFKEEHKNLMTDSWVRYATMYNYAPYNYDQFNRDGRFDYAYTAVLVSSDTNGVAIVNEFNNSNNLLRKPLGPNKFAVFYDMQSPAQRKRFEAKVESKNGSKIPFGVIVYRRPTDFTKEIQQLLNSAKERFGNLRSDAINEESNNNVFAGKLTLGLCNSHVALNDVTKKWEFIIFCNYGGDDAIRQNKKLGEFIEQKEKENVFTVKRSKSADNEEELMEVYDKNGSLLLKTQFRSYTTKIKWTFFEQ